MAETRLSLRDGLSESDGATGAVRTGGSAAGIDSLGARTRDFAGRTGGSIACVGGSTARIGDSTARIGGSAS